MRVSVGQPIIRSPRVAQVEAMFDIPPAQQAERTWNVELPLEERPWQIGLIVGPSGAGKTTVARQLWPQIDRSYSWSSEQAVIDCFPPGPIKDVVGGLTAVGFSSPPSWLRPFSTLSTGEQFRAGLARALAEAGNELVVIDEFSSTVDRQVAQVASHALQKAIRRGSGQLVALSCHYDILDWLQPDWIYQPHLEAFDWRCLRRRPALTLAIGQAHRASWRAFRQHHYLSGDLSKSARCFGGWVEGKMVCFAAIAHFPHPRTKNIYKAHRFVVSPDWQGIGINSAISEWLGEWLWKQGYRFHYTIAHPGVIAHCARSPRWQLVNERAGGSMQTTSNSGGFRKRNLNPRTLGLKTFVYSHPKGAS